MKKINEIYLYDGSLEGILTIVYDSLKTKTIPENIIFEENYISNLLDQIQVIKTDLDKSYFIFQKIKKISDLTLYRTYNVFLSDNKQKELVILYYLINAFKYGRKINVLRKLNCVIEAEKISNFVKKEAHRLKGFLRFKELDNHILYSEIAPTNNVLEIVSKHFMERLKNESFIIRDLKRNIACFYAEGKYQIIKTDEINFNNLKLIDTQEEYENLWKLFFKTIAIEERKNKKCQRNFMPKKYWPYMLEVCDELSK